MKRLLTLSIALLMSGLAYAHNGMEHVMGIVTALSATAINVKVPSGKVTTVGTDDQTMWMKGKEMMKPAELHVGDRVVIHAKIVAGKLVAAEVETAAARATQTH